MATVPSFDTFPDIIDLLEWGGVPGVQYAYIRGQNIARANEDGFEFVHGSPTFTIKGQSYVVMADTNTKPIPGAAKNSGRSPVLIDDKSTQVSQKSSV